jgi:hypothetical protein
VREESEARPANSGSQPEKNEPNGSITHHADQEALPRLTGLDSWQLPLWTTQAPRPDGVPLPGPGQLVGAGDLHVMLNSRVAGAVAARFSDRGGVQNLTLKLDPGHLGRVEVQLRARGDHLAVRITATSNESEAALRENIKDLSEAIQDKTGRFQQVDVKVDLRAQDRADRNADHSQDQRKDSDRRGQEDQRDPGGQDRQEHPDSGAEEG